jgi:hypothetical protein
MNTTKRVLAGFAALGAAITVTGVVAAPAQANDDCAANSVCMWEDAGFQSDKYVQVVPGGFPWQYDIDGWNGDNEISSIHNNTGYWIQVYGNDNASGNSICVAPGARLLNLGGFDNDAEFFQTAPPNCAW